MRSIGTTVRAAALLLPTLLAQGDFASRYGPKIGEPAPAFQAIDQNGIVRNFASLRGEKGLFLLFIRSADW